LVLGLFSGPARRANGAISGSLDDGAVARNPCVSWAFLLDFVIYELQ